jgi:uncharacterized protein
MNLFIILFIVVFISIYGIVNFYIGLRFWQAIVSNLHFINNKVYWVIFSFIVMSYIIGRVGKKFLPPLVSNGLTIVGAYWMAAMLYFLIVIIIIDLVRLFDKWTGFLPSFAKSSSFLFCFSLIALFLIVGVLAFGTWNAKNIQVNKYSFTIDKHAGSLKQLHAVMISDIHLGDIVDKKFLEDIVGKINKLKPDIVFIPGDIIDDDINPFIKQDMATTFKKIKSKYGVYASFGNHDYYGGNIKQGMTIFKNSGINVLRDAVIKVDESFYISGREDNTLERMSKVKRKPLKEIVEGIDNSLPVILLDHQPNALLESQGAGVDLQLSGHTHKGQFFPADLVTKMIFEIDYGYLKKENLNVIVSSGVGTWGPPIRIGSVSEIVDMYIKFQSK